MHVLLIVPHNRISKQKHNAIAPDDVMQMLWVMLPTPARVVGLEVRITRMGSVHGLGLVKCDRENIWASSREAHSDEKRAAHSPPFMTAD